MHRPGLLPRRPLDLREKLVEEGIEKGIEKDRLEEARAVLRRFLRARGLALGAEDEARIDECEDLGKLFPK